MDSGLDDLIQLIGAAIPVYLVVDFYFFWPKRMKKLEASSDPRDIKKLERMRYVRNVLKMHQFLVFILGLIIFFYVFAFGLLLYMKLTK